MDDFSSNKHKKIQDRHSSQGHYSDDFIYSLATEYEFDASNDKLIARVQEISVMYHVGNSHDVADSYYSKRRKELQNLHKIFKKFQNKFHTLGLDYFTYEVSYGAKLAGDLDPQLNPDDYPDKNLSYGDSALNCL